MRYFPLFYDLNHKPVLVVGGGEVACRKVESLLKAGASVTVVSPQLDTQLQEWTGEGRCIWDKGFYRKDILPRYVQVWATTNNPQLNHQVCQDARKQGIMVNVVDDPSHCDFITPSMINRGRIQVAISSGGASPVMVRNIREQFESLLGQNISVQADFAASKRSSIQKILPDVAQRRRFWETFFAHPEVEFASKRNELESVYTALLENYAAPEPLVFWQEFATDPERLMMKSLRAMQRSELVLYPKACSDDFLELIRRDAERVRYDNYAHLGTLLKQAEKDGLSVCIMVPEGAGKESGLALLMQNARYFALGKEGF